MLSIFFDGVPNRYIIDSIAGADSLRLVAIANNRIPDVQQKIDIVFHPPYLDKECENCHDKNVMGKLIEPMPAVCYQCHEDFKDLYPVLHGPVDGGFCTECHDPHKSKNDHLLKRTGQELCYYCHNSKDVLKNDVHEDIEDADCIECHNPHGGDDRYILN